MFSPPYFISIHALREEGDGARVKGAFSPSGFLSTPSARRATSASETSPQISSNFYPRPPRGGRRPGPCKRPRRSAISIHALREEGDAPCGVHAIQRKVISIHALREEGTRFPPRVVAISIHALRDDAPAPRFPSPCGSLDGSRSLFLSTPSARRATRQRPGTPPSTPDFYPRPPRGGRQVDGDRGRQQVVISIHALREEGDIRRTCDTAGWRLFLSTPSARRATKSGFRRGQCRQISIHALREEGDLTARSYPPMVCYFYPRPPRGGRHMDDVVILADSKISIHALREEGDLQVHHLFNLGKAISIHALREEGDYGFCNIVTHFLYFYPRPPRGGRPSSRGDGMRGRSFLSTPSARRATKIKKEVS